MLRSVSHLAFILCVALLFAYSCVPRLGPTILSGAVPRPAMTVYVVSDGEPATARLEIRHRRGSGEDRLMVRAFDAEENLSLWRYIETDGFELQYSPEDEEVVSSGSDLAARSENTAVWDGDIPLTGAGVHQIRVVAGEIKSKVSLALSRDQGWGVSFQNGTYSSWDDQPPILYAYVPTNAEELVVAGGPVRIYGEDDVLLAETSDSDLSESVRIEVRRTDVVWRFEYPEVRRWNFRAAGFPLILSPTIEAARKIRASTEVLPDGTVVSHKFQRRVAEALQEIVSEEKLGDSDELLALFEPLSKFEKEWLSDPRRNRYLLSAYGAVPSALEALRTQNTDPSSHWSGSMDGWQHRVDLTPPHNRWDRPQSIDGLGAGASTWSRAAENLAQMALIDAPFNPLYGRSELLYRAAASALRDLMTLGEDEVFRGIQADMTGGYPGMMAFATGQKVFPVFALVAPHMPDDIREIWGEALRRIVDRAYTDRLVSARNQSAHYLVVYQAFANGSGDPLYETLARRWARRFFDTKTPAGYHAEDEGPDASYSGMTHWFEAVYYRMSGDPVALDSLTRSYDFFNHTVAPEPDGRMAGGFNFNHRRADSFASEQWGGARGIVADLIPEVGIWSDPMSQGQADEVAKSLRRRLKNPPKARMQNFSNWRYLYFSQSDRSSTWPAESEESFIRQFGNELIAVKRPSYYVAIYVGKPASSPRFLRNKVHFQTPLPENAENTGGEINDKKITPYLGGGMSLFWTPDYGNAFIGTNLSPLARHGLVAIKDDDTRTWEDYFTTEFDLDREAGVLSITGRIAEQPIEFERRYRFGDDALHVTLTLTAVSGVGTKALFENIPILMGPFKTDGVDVAFSNGTVEEAGRINGFSLKNSLGAGVLVEFDSAREVRLQRNGLRRRSIQIGRIEVDLAQQFVAGDTVEYSYRLIPLPLHHPDDRIEPND